MIEHQSHDVVGGGGVCYDHIPILRFRSPVSLSFNGIFVYSYAFNATVLYKSQCASSHLLVSDFGDKELSED